MEPLVGVSSKIKCWNRNSRPPSNFQNKHNIAYV